MPSDAISRGVMATGLPVSANSRSTQYGNGGEFWRWRPRSRQRRPYDRPGKRSPPRRTPGRIASSPSRWSRPTSPPRSRGRPFRAGIGRPSRVSAYSSSSTPVTRKVLTSSSSMPGTVTSPSRASRISVSSRTRDEWAAPVAAEPARGPVPRHRERLREGLGEILLEHQGDESGVRRQVLKVVPVLVDEHREGIRVALDELQSSWIDDRRVGRQPYRERVRCIGPRDVRSSPRPLSVDEHFRIRVTVIYRSGARDASRSRRSKVRDAPEPACDRVPREFPTVVANEDERHHDVDARMGCVTANRPKAKMRRNGMPSPITRRDNGRK